MVVVIRADASQTIGSGHVMRCLTLAERLRLKSAEVTFICRDYPGNLSEYIRSRGFEVHLLSIADNVKHNNTEEFGLGTSFESDSEETIKIVKGYQSKIDLLIVDHYGIDYHWESNLRNWAHKIMVIDDLANRKHDCDILLDQNYYHNFKERYAKLVPKSCILFLGPYYLLLREEFYRARKNIKDRNVDVNNILIFYGGADSTNETEKCLTALKDRLNSGLEINVVTGRSNPNRERIKNICSSMKNVHYYCQVSNIEELISRADLAFGAGGTAMWERCFLGLPSIITVIAENQRVTTQAAAEFGAIWNLGWYDKVSPEHLKKVFEKMINDKVLRSKFVEKSLILVSFDDETGIDKVLASMTTGSLIES